jgi:hypothetical protein
MGMYAADGSLNIATDTGTDTNEDYAGGDGIYSKSGGLRINTTDSGPGLFAADGALRGDISDDEATPPAGVGVYTPDGAYRLTTSGSTYYNQPGSQAKDGSYKATITNAV